MTREDVALVRQIVKEEIAKAIKEISQLMKLQLPKKQSISVTDCQPEKLEK